MLVPLDVPARRWARRARASRETDRARSSAVLARLLSSVIVRAWSGHRSSLRRFVMATLQSAVKAGSGKEGRQKNGTLEAPRPRDHLAKFS
jgi:hypothetical protein